MASRAQHSFFYRNGLSITVLLLMATALAAQFLTGWQEHNNELALEGAPPMAKADYLFSGHFIQATFENWESEFLQMAVYVVLTIGLRQQGSAESKKLDGDEEVDREPQPHPDAPGPVKHGGWQLKVYQNSLSIAFAVLFILSFILHFYGSLKDQNSENKLRHKPPVTWTEHITDSRFWFESFQNWQSEFLAVGAIVLLSIWLRQKGSPESKPVDAPHMETAE